MLARLSHVAFDLLAVAASPVVQLAFDAGEKCGLWCGHIYTDKLLMPADAWREGGALYVQCRHLNIVAEFLRGPLAVSRPRRI